MAAGAAAPYLLVAMLLNILLVILVLDCIGLTAVILMQRSEGGALGMGGGPSGMFTARGAGDLLTRTTAILATAFFVLCLGITLLAGHSRSASSVTQRLKVGPVDMSSLAKPQSSAPASSSAPAAPPLPTTTAPPLPTAAQGAAPAPAAAPRPSARTRQAAPSPTQGLGDIAVQPSRPIAIPRPSVSAEAPPPPASSAPAGK